MKNFCTPILARSRETRNPSCRNRGLNQPSLFSSHSEPKPPVLSAETVPANLAIAPGRQSLVISQDERKWTYPIQFHPHELGRILPRIRKLNWALDADGVPTDIAAISWAVEQAIDGGLV